MEILGIGPGEFVLILIVLLVVVGPERLPGLARQAGQFLVRARNWLQTSPDAALVMRARAEIEAELASIKNSLMEVQVVRDEVMGAAKQLGDSVGSLTPPKLDLNSLVNPPVEQTIAANGQAAFAGEAPGLVLPDGTPATSLPLDQRSTLALPDGSSVLLNPTAEAQPTNGLGGLGHSSASAPAGAAAAALAPGELESINIRLQAIMADMWALQEQLKQRGALEETWQPPSLEVQFPTPRTTPFVPESAPIAGAEIPAELAPVAEPIEDPAVLAARKRLEELAPMRVAHLAPPVIEDVPINSADSAAMATEADDLLDETSTAETSATPMALVDPLSAPKARKRRVASTASEGVGTTDETPANDGAEITSRKRRTVAIADPILEAANDTPEIKPRKRRTPAALPSIDRDAAERSDDTEPVTTEKAS